MPDLRTVLTETQRAEIRDAISAHRLWNGRCEACGAVSRRESDHMADVVIETLAGLPGVAVTQPELADIPEPVMAQFDRLPFPMQMRVAAGVMDAVNERHRREYPTAGISANEPISSSSMRFLADYWQQDDAAAALSVEGNTNA